MAVNCGAITETLFESELFGHKRGAFTDAIADKDGLFQVAHRGSLFLDEISEMSLTAQAKLLRAIESKEILPVGGTSIIRVDVRIIAASNRDLFQEVRQGRFREDLYYRLNVIGIHLPSLAERREDIPLLVRHFIEKYNRQMNRQVKGVDPKVMQMLSNHTWKGEVRELANIVERLMIFATEDVLKFEGMPAELCSEKEPAVDISKASSLKLAVENFEREYLRAQLEKHHHHRGQTAKALGIGESTLYRKMSELGLSTE